MAGVALASFLAGGAFYWLLQPAAPHSAATSNSALDLHSIPLLDLDGAETRLEDWRGELLVVNPRRQRQRDVQRRVRQSFGRAALYRAARP